MIKDWNSVLQDNQGPRPVKISDLLQQIARRLPGDSLQLEVSHRQPDGQQLVKRCVQRHQLRTVVLDAGTSQRALQRPHSTRCMVFS